MPFVNAYNLDWTLTVNDEENLTEPFKEEISRSKNIDRSGALPGGGLPGLVVIGFAASEVIAIGDITKLGLMTVENIDPTNFIDVGPESAAALVKFVRVLPGESYPFRLTPGIVVRAQADTANVRAIIKIYED